MEKSLNEQQKQRAENPETAQLVNMIRFDVEDQMMLYSLDCLVLCYQEQRTRGFAAYEAMRCVTFSSRKKFIVGFAAYSLSRFIFGKALAYRRLEARRCGGILLIKKRLFLSPLCRRATFFYVKEGKTFGLILCNLSHSPIHKIQQSPAGPPEEVCE